MNLYLVSFANVCLFFNTCWGWWLGALSCLLFQALLMKHLQSLVKQLLGACRNSTFITGQLPKVCMCQMRIVILLQQGISWAWKMPVPGNWNTCKAITLEIFQEIIIIILSWEDLLLSLSLEALLTYHFIILLHQWPHRYGNWSCIVEVLCFLVLFCFCFFLVPQIRFWTQYPPKLIDFFTLQSLTLCQILPWLMKMCWWWSI